MHRIEVAYHPEIEDVIGAAVRREIHEDLSIDIAEIRVIEVYSINKELDAGQLRRISEELLTDPIIQAGFIGSNHNAFDAYDYFIEVGYRPGVTDNVGVSTVEGIEDLLGIDFEPHESVHTSKLYLIKGHLDQIALRKVATGYLANEVVEEAVFADSYGKLVKGIYENVRSINSSGRQAQVETVDLEVSDEELLNISTTGLLSLDLAEMQKIREYYRDHKTAAQRQAIGFPQEPTDAELEMLAQSWSEHCKHKIFNSLIDFTSDHKTSRIDSLFNTYIRGATKKISKKKPWLISVFVDNAGIISFNDTHNLVFKVETHNHPSALDPYGGAITGIVGVNRDPMGTGIGAGLIFNTDVFCFGPPDFDYDKLPEGILHPKRIFRGVRRGVEHGGNKIGIPTVNGAVLFDDAYVYNPLVYCGTGGIMPKDVCGAASQVKNALAGDLIVMVGGRVGKDGIHGATFSSTKLEGSIEASVVQIGAPIVQKKMMDALLEAQDRCLYRTLTDNGAGGLSSSVGEMAQLSGGARVYLEKVPVKYQGLQPWELWVSEAQERMTIAVPKEHGDAFLDLMQSRDVEASVIGEFTDDGKIHVTYEDSNVILLDLGFIHDGLPRQTRIATWETISSPAVEFEPTSDLTNDLIGILGSLNVCSKEWLIRQYDHEVQGTSVIKPLVGAQMDGPSDAAVLKPIHDRPEGVIIANGINPHFGKIDPYRMATAVIDEAIRNVVAVGGDPDKIALLDNFCWGNPIWSGENLDGDIKLGSLVRACQGCYDAAMGFEAPFISGKDSFHNEYKLADQVISIPPTLLISALGVIVDVDKTITMDAKANGDLVYVIGVTKPELGGSHYYISRAIVAGRVPEADCRRALAEYRLLHKVINAGLIRSCHDCSEGGLAAAAAETAFAGGFGMRLELAKVAAVGTDVDAEICFSESNHRFIVTVAPHHRDAFEKALEGAVFGCCGVVVDDGQFVVRGLDGSEVIKTESNILKEAWQAPLRW